MTETQYSRQIKHIAITKNGINSRHECLCREEQKLRSSTNIDSIITKKKTELESSMIKLFDLYLTNKRVV
ncbi:hypothetical protein BpHYR1_007083 [Brachionus plicatilis]|uniref:Uncharacterized protein n=1 Tax=Brachionus plicatilis TaxID=10195 RepID=A0A3M7PM73_BRAPC|nr:hypothetical protein BpHYR1_007083 [Brachionus plicatilis]